MTAPSGLGFWIAFESSIDPGAKPVDLAVAIGRCKRAGATWIAPRAGQDGLNDGAFNRASCEAFAAAGLDVYPWVFVDPGRNAGTIAAFAKMRDWPGVAGAILNAEFAYQAESPDNARALVAGVRAAGYDFVAHAPPDYLGGYGATKSLRALDNACDVVMPQVYAFEHNDAGHVAHLDRVLALYAKLGLSIDKVWPILCTYRPHTRGFDKDNKPIPTPKIANEPQIVADDLIAGLDRIAACPAPSLYSLDAISWINGASDRVMAALESRAIALAPKPVEPADLSPPVDPRGPSPANVREFINGILDRPSNDDGDGPNEAA